MKKSKKIIIIVFSVVVFLGLLLGVIGLYLLGFDFTKLDTSKRQTRTYEITEDFNALSLDMRTARLQIRLAEDGQGKVVCYEREKEPHTVLVQDGVLRVRGEDNRKWHEHIGFYFRETEVCVYLPKTEYDRLTVESDTGDIYVAKGLTFGYGSVETDTGDVYWQATAVHKLSLSTDTGDIEARGLTGLAVVDLETDTGDIDLVDTSCANLTMESDTGDVELERVLIAEGLWIETSTGDVELVDSDAATIKIKTSTGDVSGRLLSDKTFITKTGTGDVDVPRTTGGVCEVVTSTGDIEFKIKR